MKLINLDKFFKGFGGNNAIRNNVVNNTTNAGKKMTNKVKEQLKSNNILLVLLFGICIAVLVYLLLLFNRPSLLYYTLAGIPIKANDRNLSALDDSNKLPSLKNGREYAYSFWTYIESIENQDKYRLVFLRGNELGDANPFVYFDKNSNKMIIKVKTSAAGGTIIPVANTIPTGPLQLDSVITAAGSDGSPEKTLHQDTCKFATFEIDYVPLQRWVNVIINVDNYVATIFMDGAIHSTRVLNENNDDCETDLSKIVEETSGELKVGNESSNLPAFNGYISKVQFFNYSLKTQRHISKVYEGGPVESQSILQKLGLPLYAFRNPIYRVDNIKT